MIFLYAGIPAVILLISAVLHIKDRKLYKNIDIREHPLKVLYPAAAMIVTLKRRFSNNKRASASELLMKQLTVRKNVDTEMYLFSLKRISYSMSVILAACIFGMFLSISQQGHSSVTTLSRAGPGGGKTDYRLDAEYEGSLETIDVSLEEAHLTEEEILNLFDSGFKEVTKIFLGSNESLDHISRPVNLIRSYGMIQIEWMIPDTSLLSYTGAVSEDITEDDNIPLSIYATFTADGVSEAFSFPLILTKDPVSAEEQLKDSIMNEINENNSVYDTEVTLPDTLNGSKISFSTPSDNTAQTVFIIGIIGAAAIFILFGKALEKESEKRKEQLAADFPEIAFKLSLLYEAGLSIFRSWERIVEEYEAEDPKEKHYAYLEMRFALEQIKNGTSEADAYASFGRRCGTYQYIKLGNILEQNLAKGAKGMRLLLRQEVSEAFEERKKAARKKGEEASTKMLLPLVMMLVVVIIIVAVPALMSIQL